MRKAVFKKAVCLIVMFAMVFAFVGVVPEIEVKAETAMTLQQLRNCMLSGYYTAINGDTIEKGVDENFINIKKKGDTTSTPIPMSRFKLLEDSDMGSADNFKVAVLPEGTQSLDGISDYTYIYFKVYDQNVNDIYIWNQKLEGTVDLGIANGVRFYKPISTAGINLNAVKSYLQDGAYICYKGDTIQKASDTGDFINITKKVARLQIYH